MFSTLLGGSVLLLSLLLFAVALIYTFETVTGLLPGSAKRVVPLGQRPGVAIIVPAHDEEITISSTLASLKPQLRSGDRLIVVADNCRDRTADLARAAGAEVVERQNRLQRGKGYALSAGVRHLQYDPRPYVFFVDADCLVRPGALDHLVYRALETGQPVQARNLMTTTPGASLNLKISEFAFLVKNLVRPSGLARMGLPIALQGTGMLIPWKVVQQVDLATDDVAEDLQLSFDLAQLGYRPAFCPEAKITSYFPQSAEGALSQRRRWEGGHLNAIWRSLAYLALPSSIRSFPALVMLLDRLVPPTTLLFLMLAGWSLLAAILSTWQDLPPAVATLPVLALALMAGSTLLVWFVKGRSIVPARSLALVPLLALKKLAFYWDLVFVSRSQGWVRTDRGK